MVVQADRAVLPIEVFDSEGCLVPATQWREAAARLGVVATAAATAATGRGELR